MKHLILIAMMLASSSILAQMTPEKAANYQNTIMSKELNLTEDQKNSLAVHNLEFSKKQIALMNAPGSMLGKIGDMRAINRKKKEALAKILTQEQMKKYEDDVEPAIRKYMRKNIKS